MVWAGGSVAVASSVDCGGVIFRRRRIEFVAAARSGMGQHFTWSVNQVIPCGAISPRGDRLRSPRPAAAASSWNPSRTSLSRRQPGRDRRSRPGGPAFVGPVQRARPAGSSVWGTSLAPVARAVGFNPGGVRSPRWVATTLQCGEAVPRRRVDAAQQPGPVEAPLILEREASTGPLPAFEPIAWAAAMTVGRRPAASSRTTTVGWWSGLSVPAKTPEGS